MIFHIAVQCHYCSQMRNPSEVTRLGKIVMCWHCYEWHQHALKLLSGTPPPGCQQCNITFDELNQVAKNGDVKMYVHVKDGIYQILCPSCSDQYVPKRVDLFKGTAFAHTRKL